VIKALVSFLLITARSWISSGTSIHRQYESALLRTRACMCAAPCRVRGSVWLP